MKYGNLELNITEYNTETLVISTHGIIKKVSKVPKSEIEKVERIRKEYFNN